MQQILVSDYVDIFGIVYAMRKERVWMVQTEQQYICIHQCLLAVLEGKEITGSPREIHENQGFEGELRYMFLLKPNSYLLICINNNKYMLYIQIFLDYVCLSINMFYGSGKGVGNNAVESTLGLGEKER